ncbi:hypothetical protein F4781DRAFT_439568 [Annulohypoxylon bovei var. microspora]|nr:hypothetical protein F4781DRAFT_439568 [Annulohypoxylon bovei var. microspora]
MADPITPDSILEDKILEDKSTFEDKSIIEGKPTIDVKSTVGNVTTNEDKALENKSTVENKSTDEGKPTIDDKSTVEYVTAPEDKTTENMSTIEGKTVVDDKTSVEDKTTVEDKSVAENKTAAEDETAAEGETAVEHETKVEHNPTPNTTIAAAPFVQTTLGDQNFLMSDVRVGAPHPPAMPCQHGFIGHDMSAKLMKHLHEIEKRIHKDMGDDAFTMDIVMVSTEAVILHQMHRPTVLVNAARNSNIVRGEPWAMSTMYIGSRWLYIVDKIRRYLIDRDLADVSVEFREYGLEHTETTPFVQPGSVHDYGAFDEFNRGRGLMYNAMQHLCMYDANITDHLMSVEITWMAWPHNSQYGDFEAVFFEFDLNFDERHFWPIARVARALLDVAGHDWKALPVLFKWESKRRLGW